MTLEASFSRFAVRRVHIREVTGSSPVVPIFLIPGLVTRDISFQETAKRIS